MSATATATASTETSANGFTNGVKVETNGTNGVGHHHGGGGGGGGEHEEMQYLNLIRRIIDSGE